MPTATKPRKPKASANTAPPALPVKPPSDHILQSMKLAADSTRATILLTLLSEGSTNVTVLCGKLCQSQPVVSHHLALLRVRGMIEPTRDGKNIYYQLGDVGKSVAVFMRKLSEVVC